MYLKRFGFLLLTVSAAFCTPVFAAITSKEYVDEHVKNQVSTLATKAEVPTKVSDLTNDSGFITAFDIPSAPNVPTKVSEFENDAKYVTETAMGTELSSYAKTATVNTELAKKANTSDLANYATTSAMNTALAAKADSTALNALATKTEVSEGLAKKQNTLSAVQQAAVDSGITADKVSTYDGYAAQIAGKQVAGDYATNTALTSGLAGKQNTLSTVQQAAVDSGITATKVAAYDAYAEQIASKQAAGDYALKSELPTATSDLTNDSGFITNSALVDYAKSADVNTELAKKANASDLANYATNTALTSGLAGKQNTLSTAQQAAVDSGITAGKVAAYDGYAAQIAGKQAAGDYALKSDLPTATSDLTNDSGFITNAALADYAKSADVNTELAKKANTSDLANYATNTALTSGLAGKQNTLSTAQQAAVDSGITADKVSTYDGYAAQISAKANAADLSGHIANTENPHAVTKAQVGLGNVQNVDQTNASNLTSGTVAYGRLPVGTAASTVAAGNDVRFNTIPTTQPSGTPPSGQVFIWFN